MFNKVKAKFTGETKAHVTAHISGSVEEELRVQMKNRTGDTSEESSESDLEPEEETISTLHFLLYIDQVVVSKSLEYLSFLRLLKILWVLSGAFCATKWGLVYRTTRTTQTTQTYIAKSFFPDALEHHRMVAKIPKLQADPTNQSRRNIPIKFFAASTPKLYLPQTGRSISFDEAQLEFKVARSIEDGEAKRDDPKALRKLLLSFLSLSGTVLLPLPIPKAISSMLERRVLMQKKSMPWLKAVKPIFKFLSLRSTVFQLSQATQTIRALWIIFFLFFLFSVALISRPILTSTPITSNFKKFLDSFPVLER
ncbi:hypothetical protein F5880DRAFT_1512121 [Lentinula raphanica]|nr:hypothetical protein F5880DRAFT_1512121 [Lentinula raphanica]